MTVSLDARTPSASVHALSGSTPPGAGTTMQPFGIPTVPAASVGAAVMPLGGGFDVVGRPRSCGPDAQVIDLAGRVERLAKREQALWGRRADLDDAVTKAMPARPVRPGMEHQMIAAVTTAEGARTVAVTEPAGWLAEHRARAAAYAAAVAEHERRVAEVAARLGLPLVEKLTHRASARLGRWGLRLAAMEPRTQAGLKAKAAASRATGEDGELLDPWRERLASSLGRDAIRIIEAESSANGREHRARDAELFSLIERYGPAYRAFTTASEKTVAAEDAALNRIESAIDALAPLTVAGLVAKAKWVTECDPRHKTSFTPAFIHQVAAFEDHAVIATTEAREGGLAAPFTTCRVDVTREVVETYRTFLELELSHLNHEVYGRSEERKHYWLDNPAGSFHGHGEPAPSTRAAAVLTLLGLMPDVAERAAPAIASAA